MNREPVGQLALDREDRIERRHRLLEDHPHFVAADRRIEFGIGAREVEDLAVRVGRASGCPSAMRPPPNSTSRINDSEVTDLPDPDSPTTQTVSPGLIEKRHVVDADDRPAVGVELDAQVLDRNERFRRLSRSLSATCQRASFA